MAAVYFSDLDFTARPRVMSGVWPRVVPGVGGGISQTPIPGQSTSQHYTVHYNITQYRMIVQDDSTGHK